MFNRKKNILKEIRQNWGKQIKRYRNFDLISSYHDLKSKFDKDEVIDDKTWSDLNLDSLFVNLDRTTSNIGQQFLYHLIRKYEKNKNALDDRYNLFSFFKDNAKIRETIQLKLTGLDNTKSYFISSLIFGDIPERPRFYYFLYLLPMLTILSFILVPFYNSFLLVGVGLSIFNIIVNLIFSKSFHKYFSGFYGLNRLITCAEAIAKVDTENKLPQVDFLRKNRSVLTRLRKKMGYIVIDKSGGNDIILLIIEYLNIILLYDLLSYLRSIEYIKAKRKIIQQTFEAIAELDVSIAIASYLMEIPYYCVPNFIQTKEISFNEVYHPLIKDAVSNTVNKISQSVLITGSNMAGKTTFIKTIGINFILAQTLNICLAKEASLPMLIVKSAIKREDDLEHSKSYYYVEIERLLDFIELSKDKSEYLFLIDEIFRGTNTVERLSSSTAVLNYLDKNNFIFVTTHDIELQHLLNNTFIIFHFSEQVTNNHFYFDYKIKEGATFSGNAIKLLELKGYPESVVNNANSVKEILLKNQHKT
jgi:DNA mismatch repair ATPase MutS